ncbi:ABC transporter permease [Futiania mangrovi]|uniref:ABC transporter permease n=1 Tax=Futiania mangrovi TaxID=2959716 RepID=A0A9J6PH48_9PROT|nr:ABC transporter permease [Futiania mangrovii]MCP1337144.1 ABC transporter permease [Futiania mangrovii]
MTYEMRAEDEAIFHDRLRKARRDRLSRNLFLPLLSGLLGLGFWEVAVILFDFPVYLLPAPTVVVEAMIEKWSFLQSNLIYTVIASITGFTIALVGGVFLGAAITASAVVDRMAYPWLVISHAIPKVVVAPLLLVWVGFGIKSGIIFVVVFTFFPIVVNTVTGLKSSDPDLLQLVRSMGATPRQALWKIRIPNALPHIFAGIKISATLAPVGAVIGEFVASNEGLGYVLIQAVGNLETPLAFAAVFIISAFGILIWYLAEMIERLSIPWHASQRESPGAT